MKYLIAEYVHIQEISNNFGVFYRRKLVPMYGSKSFSGKVLIPGEAIQPNKRASCVIPITPWNTTLEA